MKIILRQTVENLGHPGDIVNVKPGYAHNFLIPEQMALPVNEGNLKRVENEKKILAVKEAKMREDAEAIAKQFSGTKLVFEKKAGLEGILYGSVTAAEISEGLDAKGLEVDKRRLIIPEAIKRIGEFEVKARLHPEVDLSITILVKSEDGLAEEAMAAAAAKKAESAPAVEAPVEEPVAEAVSDAESEPVKAEADDSEKEAAKQTEE